MQSVGVENGELCQGMACHRVTLPNGDSVLVARHGAQVLSWVAGGVERLYLSPLACMDGRSAIRGGVPICFPQFNQRGSLPRHGFARNTAWELQPVAFQGDAAKLRLTQCADESTRALWPHEFAAAVEIDLRPGSLQVSLRVENNGASPLAFTGALHTYLAVDGIADACLTGLDGQDEWDAVRNVHGAADNELRFNGEFDRVYTAAPSPLVLRCGLRTLQISQSPAWAHTVVWNPGAQRCADMTDMPADGFQQMLCVEAAQVFEPIRVEPGQVWQGWQRLVSTMDGC